MMLFDDPGDQRVSTYDSRSYSLNDVYELSSHFNGRLRLQNRLLSTSAIETRDSEVQLQIRL